MVSIRVPFEYLIILILFLHLNITESFDSNILLGLEMKRFCKVKNIEHKEHQLSPTTSHRYLRVQHGDVFIFNITLVFHHRAFVTIRLWLAKEGQDVGHSGLCGRTVDQLE